MLARQLQTKMEERVESSTCRYAENEREKGEARICSICFCHTFVLFWFFFFKERAQ